MDIWYPLAPNAPVRSPALLYTPCTHEDTITRVAALDGPAARPCARPHVQEVCKVGRGTTRPPHDHARCSAEPAARPCASPHMREACMVKYGATRPPRAPASALGCARTRAGCPLGLRLLAGALVLRPGGLGTLWAAEPGHTAPRAAIQLLLARRRLHATAPAAGLARRSAGLATATLCCSATRASGAAARAAAGAGTTPGAAAAAAGACCWQRSCWGSRAPAACLCLHSRHVHQRDMCQNSN